MIWRVRNIGTRYNVRFIHKRTDCHQPPLYINRLICPFDQKPARSHRYSSQWTSKPRVFPIFDLKLLDSSLKTEEERTTGYEPREIHAYPVKDEEILNDRYHILHQIGYGPTATVWYAIDLMDPRMVVLKIYVVDHALKSYGRLHPPQVYRRSECPLHTVSDRFSIKGPHGIHICVVHEGPPIDTDQMHPGEKLDIESTRSTIEQMLIMMDFLHTDCYLNARIQPNESLNTDSDYRRVAGPNNGHIIAPMILPGDGVPLLLAARADDMSDISENHSRAPEEILNSTWDHRTEIWAIGFYAWGYASPVEMIDGRNSNGAFDDRVHIAELVALLGPPPPRFRDKMRLGSLFWDEEGNWTGQAPIPDRSFESLAVSGNFDGYEKGFLQWIRKAMQWDSEDRPTALGLLRHEWMSQKTRPKEGDNVEASSVTTEA